VGADPARLAAVPRADADVVERLLDRERGAHGPLGVVLVRARDAERGHDGVAGELLHGAAVVLDAACDLLEEARHPPPHDLGVAGGAEPRRVDEVGEEDGGELPLHALDAMEGEGPPREAQRMRESARPPARRAEYAG